MPTNFVVMSGNGGLLTSDAGDGILRLCGVNSMPGDSLAPQVTRSSAGHEGQITRIAVVELIVSTWVKLNPRYDSKCEHIFYNLQNKSAC